MATIAQKKEQDKRDAVTRLKHFLGDNPTIYTVCRHVSASGMSRRISCFIANAPDSIQCVDWYIEKLGTYKRHRTKEGLVVGGCGMDMGFSVVYNTSADVFNGEERAGYKIKQKWL